MVIIIQKGFTVKSLVLISLHWYDHQGYLATMWVVEWSAEYTREKEVLGSLRAIS